MTRMTRIGLGFTFLCLVADPSGRGRSCSHRTGEESAFREVVEFKVVERKKPAVKGLV